MTKPPKKVSVVVKKTDGQREERSTSRCLPQKMSIEEKEALTYTLEIARLVPDKWKRLGVSTLAREKSISFRQALALIERADKNAGETIAKINKSKRKARKLLKLKGRVSAAAPEFKWIKIVSGGGVNGTGRRNSQSRASCLSLKPARPSLVSNFL